MLETVEPDSGDLTDSPVRIHGRCTPAIRSGRAIDVPPAATAAARAISQWSICGHGIETMLERLGARRRRGRLDDRSARRHCSSSWLRSCGVGADPGDGAGSRVGADGLPPGAGRCFACSRSGSASVPVHLAVDHLGARHARRVDGDAVHDWTAPWHAWLARHRRGQPPAHHEQRLHRSVRPLRLGSSLVGPSLRPGIALLVLFAFRQMRNSPARADAAGHDLAAPRHALAARDLRRPRTTSSSGHTAIAVLGAIEIARSRAPGGGDRRGRRPRRSKG